MLKNLCQLECIISDKACRFICDNDTDINIIKEALFQFQKFIGAVEDAAKAQQTNAPVDPNLPPVEASQPDPIDEQKQVDDANE